MLSGAWTRSRLFATHLVKLGLVTIVLALTGLAPFGAAAAEPSPVGLWKTIDDETGEAKSLVRVALVDGLLSGRIEKILTPGRENAVCKACEGSLKDQPVVGMQILQNMKWDDDQFEGGTILDPNNGKTYKCLVWLEGAKKLNVRGYIGVPMFGRSQIWLRAE